jgi:hypothetical protein
MKKVSPRKKRLSSKKILEITLASETACTLNRRCENVVIEAVIIAKLELCDIERDVLCTDIVERADDTALEDAPKTLNRLGVDRTDNVLAARVVNGFVRKILVEALVANPLSVQSKLTLCETASFTKA